MHQRQDVAYANWWTDLAAICTNNFQLQFITPKVKVVRTIDAYAIYIYRKKVEVVPYPPTVVVGERKVFYVRHFSVNRQYDAGAYLISVAVNVRIVTYLAPFCRNTPTLQN